MVSKWIRYYMLFEMECKKDGLAPEESIRTWNLHPQFYKAPKARVWF